MKKTFVKGFLYLQIILSPLFVFAGTKYLDVRTPQEYTAEHVQGALNIDVTSPQFDSQVKKLSKEDHYFVYCRSGKRAGIAVGKMKKMGFKNLENVGGLQDAEKLAHKK